MMMDSAAPLQISRLSSPRLASRGGKHRAAQRNAVLDNDGEHILCVAIKLVQQICFDAPGGQWAIPGGAQAQAHQTCDASSFGPLLVRLVERALGCRGLRQAVRCQLCVEPPLLWQDESVAGALAIRRWLSHAGSTMRHRS